MDTDTSFHACWQSWCQYLGPIENADLADICEVSSAAVTGWLNGSRKPRANKISRLSNFIHELITDRKVVIAPHNRSDFTTICTTYQHQGDFPTASGIRATFEGTVTVEQVLGLTSNIAETEFKPINSHASQNNSRFVRIYAVSFLALSIVCIIVGGAFMLSRIFTESSNSLFKHSELALSVDGDVRKVSLSHDGQHRAFLWKPPGSDNFDVYLIDEQHIITPILQSEADEMGLDWSPDGNNLFYTRFYHDGIWKISLGQPNDLEATNQPVNIVESLKPGAWMQWQLIGQKLYFIERDLDGFRLMKLDLADPQSTKLFDLPATWRSDFSFFVRTYLKINFSLN